MLCYGTAKTQKDSQRIATKTHLVFCLETGFFVPIPMVCCSYVGCK